MNDLNNVNMIGRLVRELETTITQSGMSIGKFTLANNQSVKVNGNYEDKAGFFRCVMFGKQIEGVGRFLLKGKQIAITGKLTQREWKDKEDKQRSSVEILVNTVQLLGSKRDDQQPAPQPQSGKQMLKDEFTPEESDDVPF